MKKLFLIIFFCFFAFASKAQCPSGAIGASGAGCGCLGSCNLTSFGGPNCSPAVGGNCNGGYQSFFIDIAVPDGCTYTVTALMENRPGCSASGADGNCQGCDNVKVDIPAGPKVFQQAGGNGSITDNYTLAGPSTIRVSGSANRADEIVTYSITSSGAFCVDCASILPVELSEFNGNEVENGVMLSWQTKSELNNKYFTLERSRDGINFEPFYNVSGQGNSSSTFNYNILDSSPYSGLNYYRLKQTDFNEEFKYSKTISVLRSHESFFEMFPNPAENNFTLRGKNFAKFDIQISNQFGQKVDTPSAIGQNDIQFDTSLLEPGVYFVRVTFNDIAQVKKLVIR